MKNKIGLLVLVVLAFTLGGCDSRLIKDDKKDLDTASLVFGYIDMSDAPSDLRWVGLLQVSPKSDKPFWTLADVDEGMFWYSHMGEGTYQFHSFGGYSFWQRVNFTFDLQPKVSESSKFKLGSKPGIYYLGSYKFKEVKTAGFFTKSKFDFVATKSPTERELLERLLKYTKGPIWEARIKQRMAELPK